MFGYGRAMRDWHSKQAARTARIEAGSRFATGKLVAPADLTPFLEAVLRPGDRVCLEGDNQKQADVIARALAAVDPARIHDLHMVQSGVVLPEHLDLFDSGIARRLDFSYSGPQSARIAKMLFGGKIELGAIHTYLELFARYFVDLTPQVALIAAVSADRHGNLYTGPNTEDTPTVVEATSFGSGLVIAQVGEIVDTLPRVDIPGDQVHFVLDAGRPFYVEPLFTRDPAAMTETQILTAMMAIKGLYQPYGVRRLNHGIGFNTAAIELLLPTYGEKLGLKGGRKGKSGVYSTDVTELERIAREKGPHTEIVRKVLEWRQLTKLKNTYTDALQAQINPRTGRVHTSYSLTGAQTGRLSSTEPNLQNIPIRTEVGRQIRDAFVAEPGNVILAADYSQIELRLAAHMADVPALRDAFANGDDIHSLTAMELFGEVNRDTRGRAKTINFAILYGISRWGLAGRLDVSAEEAQAMIDRYFERFPGINTYIAETTQSVRERGFTTTLFGRKTHFPRIRSKVQHERQGAERAAINAPIQGTSADIIKRAMVRMEPALLAAGLPNVQMLLQVHDELVFELPEGDVDAAKPVIERVMAEAAQPAVTLSVPLGIEIGTGASWGAAH